MARFSRAMIDQAAFDFSPTLPISWKTMNTHPDTRGFSRLARFVLVVVAGIVMASCGSGGGGGGTTQMRVFNAIFGGAPVTVTVGTSTAATALPFQGLTTYKQVSNGSQELKVVAAGSTSPIVDTT